MVPIELTLSNFKSFYRIGSSIDFTQFKTVCIIGSNGAGKSSIIEGIIWALYGNSPVSNSQLIHKGETEMEVDFIFEQKGAVYRIIRKYSKKGGGSDLSIFRVENDSEELIDFASRISNAQRFINRLLGMDYNGFRNASFITQGEADSFTKNMKPSQRKNLLSSILGLDIYERINSLSKEKIKLLERDFNHYTQNIESIQNTLLDINQLHSQLSKLEKDIEENKYKFNSLQTRDSILKKGRERIQAKINHIQSCKLKYNQQQELMEYISNQIKTKQNNIAEFQELISNKEKIINLLDKKNALEKLYENFAEKEREYSHLNLENHKLKSELESLKQSIISKIEKLETLYRSKEKDINGCKKIITQKEIIQKDYHYYSSLLDKIEQMEKERISWQKKREKLAEINRLIDKERALIEGELKVAISSKMEYSKMVSHKDDLSKRLEETERRISSLENLKLELDNSKQINDTAKNRLEELKNKQIDYRVKRDEIERKIEMLKVTQNAKCPLCDSGLEREKRDELLHKFKTEREMLIGSIEENEKSVKSLVNQINSIQKKITDLKKAIENLANPYLEKGKIEEHFVNINRAENKILELDKQLKVLEYKLKESDYSPELFTRKKSLEREIKSLNFSETLFEKVKNEIKKNKEIESKFANLQRALTDHEILSSELKELSIEIEKNKLILQKEEYSNVVREKIHKVKKRIEQLKYDPSLGIKLKKQISELKDTELRYSKLQEAFKKLPIITSELNELLSKKEGIKSVLIELESIIGQSDRFQKALGRIEGSVRRIDNMIEDIRSEIMRLEVERVRNNQQLKENLEKKERLKDLKIKKDNVIDEINLHSIITDISGKNGIQATIISTVLPEIEDETNRLLSLLTDGNIQLQLQFEHKGGVEKLHTKFITQDGLQHYDSFSGGESFRIDFAIRIALSRFLSNRAGKALKTLVIDEGFGTQDAEGLRTVIECLNAIEPEFEKIIVITHLEEFKNYFSNKLLVTKTHKYGSRVELI